jgi:tRNA(Ile)-lysidine synthase
MIKKKEIITNKNNKKNISASNKVDYLLLLKNRRNLTQDPIISGFLKKLSNIIKNKLCLSAGDKVVLAVSGGVDSVVMLDSFSQISLETGLILSVVHFNHSLREESSERDEKFVYHLAHSYGLHIHTTKKDVKAYAAQTGLSIEQAARDLRYSFFEKIANSTNSHFIATAHTADDSAETVLINLLRGSGITGLSGISVKRPLTKKITVIRPFIDFHKQELIKYAQLQNLKWYEDETNELVIYTRNKVRNILLPLLKNEFNPSIIDTINRTALHIEGADSVISEHTNNALNSIRFDKKTEKLSVKISWFKSFSRFMQGEILQKVLETYYNMPPQSLSVIDRVIGLSDSATGALYDITPQIYALKDREYIYLGIRKIVDIKEETINPPGIFDIGDIKLTMKVVKKNEVIFNTNPNIEYFDFDKINNPLIIRSWKTGDVFHPLGTNGSMKLSDFLINEKIDLIEKQNIRVLCAGKEIAWVIGNRISDNFKITENTKKYLQVTLNSI